MICSCKLPAAEKKGGKKLKIQLSEGWWIFGLGYGEMCRGVQARSALAMMEFLRKDH